MKAAPLLVAWHDDNGPIYSAHFERQGKGRLATAGGDSNVRLWSIESNADERKVTYLSTLRKHTQAVNVVRWCPRGELLASAGDDGNVLLWTPADNPAYASSQTVRQIAEHNHYVQGVAWDPLNEYVATQSSDRSVHIYTLKTKDGQFTLNQHNKVTKMDLPTRRISSNSPAPPDLGGASHRASFIQDMLSEAIGSPKPSAPGTPQSLALPMNPPPTSHSRRSSFGSQSMRRSVSPSPSMPLPAVMPSASPSISGSIGLGVRNTNIYANETFTSFFRRLTFTPDGSLLLTPAGQFKTTHPAADGGKNTDEIINTVYIYTRAGLNKPPVAYLPGHKKPSIAVKCSPIYYQLRTASTETKEITIDTRTEEDLAPLPEPAMPSKAPTSHAAMEPPPLMGAPSPAPSATAASPRPRADSESNPSTPLAPPGPVPHFGLPYRMVNLHYATFTDLSWSGDGLTLLMTSSDGFCSALTFAPGELGAVYQGPIGSASTSRPSPAPISVSKANSSTASTPQPTPTGNAATTAAVPRHSSTNSGSGLAQPTPIPPHAAASPSPFAAAVQREAGVRPASPARSMSASSIATEASFAKIPDQNAVPVMNNPTPSMGAVPSNVAAGSSSTNSSMPLFTPPQTPGQSQINASTSQNPPTVSGVKRDSNAGVQTDSEEQGREKRRRIAPTPVEDNPPPAASGAGGS
ncbi:uncharacterized protein MYCFIDRAFT_184373 [Pseudocercospora fijiensis CIRAD86]|uniref:Uncharacterized protein n=1 Tax=Pseudocercospora fijiensis (strain CIRAD86) TaxID=383855 RepID=N1Q8N3_PSEFD|nr:uncharacterized protein MYCFIDRAFT_184373 [Pseudocercospora fijiensis CIRAD86]EME87282.1 hypothetical protein MYCFIDRAFT_184373 [Pseudocercospora fijiensis CIRAD86]